MALSLSTLTFIIELIDGHLAEAGPVIGNPPIIDRLMACRKEVCEEHTRCLQTTRCKATLPVRLRRQRLRV